MNEKEASALSQISSYCEKIRLARQKFFLPRIYLTKSRFIAMAVFSMFSR